ncbi:MAG: hypothetical protein ACTSPV_03955 [Candidatus Hodarchaeales archaeon]
MRGSEKFSVYIATFIFVIIGYLVSLILSDILANIFLDLDIDFLSTGNRVGLLVLAIGWFIVSFLTGWGSTHWVEEGEKTGLISPFFFLLWIISSFGVVVALIVNDLLFSGSPVIINLDSIINQFFGSLIISLPPATAVLLSVSNKRIT